MIFAVCATVADEVLRLAAGSAKDSPSLLAKLLLPTQDHVQLYIACIHCITDLACLSTYAGSIVWLYGQHTVALCAGR